MTRHDEATLREALDSVRASGRHHATLRDAITELLELRALVPPAPPCAICRSEPRVGTLTVCSTCREVMP